jgi:CubicO group peptidase (beta-lactamase class C family)
MKQLLPCLAAFSVWSLSAQFPASAIGAAPSVTAPFAWETTTPESQGMSSRKLDALKEVLAAKKTRAFLVIRNDKIVYEWHAPGITATTKQGTASLAKALVGGISLAVAITDGKISIDDPAAKFIPPWKNDPRKSRITIRHLGSHTSGLADAELNELPHDKLTGWMGDFWKRLDPPRDPFTLARDEAPTLFAPGEKLQYSNPGIGMMAYCVTAAIRDGEHKDIRTLLRERVMRPIGVPDAEWSVGYTRTYVVDGLPLIAPWGGGSYTARAVARVARLMLRKGNWEGQQLLTPEAVRSVTTDAGSVSTCAIGWWSNNQGVVAAVPKDAFWGSGAGHQCVIVVPSLGLIAVRNGQVLSPGPHRQALDTWLFDPLMNAVTDRK